MGSKPTEHAAGDHRKYRVNRQGSAELGDEFVVVFRVNGHNNVKGVGGVVSRALLHAKRPVFPPLTLPPLNHLLVRLAQPRRHLPRRRKPV